MFCARIFFISVLISPLFAQNSASPPRLVQASAEATVTAKPDRAQVTIGVVTESATAKSAAAQNATQTAQLIQNIKRLLQAKGDVKTQNYSINPEYQYGNNTPPKLTSYRADNSVIVTLDDLSLVAEVIDTATDSGANTISGVNFSLKDDEPVRNQAIAAAAIKARASAEAIARALNLHVLGILQAQTLEAADVRPVANAAGGNLAMMKQAAVPTPVETGTLEIRETVLVTLLVQ